LNQNIVIPLISSIIALIFALTVLDQFFARRRPYQLLWAIGLFMYFISTGTEFWTGAWGLNQVVYRLWYLIGAIFVAAYLGMGTIYLLAPRRTAKVIMVVLLIASLYATFKVFTVSLDLSTLDHLSGRAMPLGVRLLTPFFNTFGTVALVGGAIYSAWVYWRHRIMPHRVMSNILIAVGALLPAFGGIHIRLGGGIQLFYLFELLGIIIIFVGFLRSREVFGLYRIPLIHGFRKVTKPIE
jgi:glucan phosphoethanolaminetransferase (alkaline phosphatase superfamily)